MPDYHMEQPITQTLEENYMPYAMSVIVSRAIPEMDGFKPSHRKLLYTMYKMGLLTGNRTKSANVVGQTMKLNPHGDQTIYETAVRLSRGHEALLHSYIDSKGNFGKHYSRDMAYAAARYTECKLDSICTELFRDIDKETVDFADNYDNTMKEPTLLPVTFPSILVNANTGIAVGMASSICSFNLKEVCYTAIERLKDPQFDVSQTLIAPDFSTGGQIILSPAQMREIFDTGRGSFKVRSKYVYDKKNNCIEVIEIPYSTTVEAIIEKIVDHIKSGKIREISDIRDETDLSGLKIAIDLKRGTDPDILMQRLYNMTPLEDSFSCNFNILVAGTPRVMGVGEILDEWGAFRIECVKRQIYYDLNKKKDRMHLLLGLEKILLDIDKAIKIIRETDEEQEVIPNLMIGFGIDEIQAEFIADIKLRNLNREYILKKTDETSELEKEIKELSETIESKKKIKNIIIAQLKEIIKKYGKERKTSIIYESDIEVFDEEDHIDDYPVHLFLTKSGYFKKITPQSLRMSGEHKLKEGDEIFITHETTNKSELLFFTDKCQVYKAHTYDFDDTKTSVLGDYLPQKLSLDEGENIIYMTVTTDYSGNLLFFFRNGKCAKINLSSYETKTNRKKLVNAYSDKSPVTAIFRCDEDADYVLYSSNGKVLIANSAMIPLKATKSSQGVNVMVQKAKAYLYSVEPFSEGNFEKPHLYKTKTIPAVGRFLRDADKKTGEPTLF